jgi:hypothetical protein
VPQVPPEQVTIAKDALVGLRSALAIRRGLPRPDAVCSAVQMQEMAKCGAVVRQGGRRPGGVAAGRRWGLCGDKLLCFRPCTLLTA